MKFNTKLLWDYINGEEIENIEKLEEDTNFMMQVIIISNDKKIYNLCSNKVKKDYQFIKFLIYKFKEDKQFINKITSEYLNNQDLRSVEYNELIFILSDIFDDFSEEAMNYKIKKFTFYEEKRLIYEMCIQNEIDLNLKKDYGLGFVFALNDEEVASSNIITRYFAYKYVSEIFNEQIYSLEEILHKLYPDFSKIEEKGIKKFILDYISYYDIALSDYLHTNLDLISDLEKRIKEVGKKWNYYNNYIKDLKKDILYQETMELIYEKDVLFTCEDVFNYIDAMKLIPEKLSFQESSAINIFDIKKLDFNSRLCLKEIIKLVKELYSSPIIEKRYLYNDKPAEVLDFTSYTKKRK